MTRLLHAAAAVLMLILASGCPASGAEPERPAVVYAAGDSIAAGTGLAFGWQSWPQRTFDRTFGPDRTRARTVAHPGQCLIATICTGQPLVQTWQAEVLQAEPRPTTVIVESGRNDLAHVSDTQMVATYRWLRDTATAAGVRMIVMTILPAGLGYTYWDQTEPQRRRVNAAIRAEFGADVADAAAAIGDNLYGWYDSGDHIHPAWPAHVVAADSVPIGRIV